MKKINKTEPSFYTNFVKKNKPNNWEDCLEITYPIRKYILKNEQNFQCAYCEAKISPDKTMSHIDHFKKKAGHLFPELIYDYFNLLVSCNNPYHCASHKDKSVKYRKDYQSIVNPVTDDPNDYFEYAFTGDIIPKNHKATYTRDIFKLNHPGLVNRRKIIAMQVSSYKNQLSLEKVIEIFGEFESFIRDIW